MARKNGDIDLPFEEWTQVYAEEDERVLRRREWETDEEYGKRMRDYLNNHDIYEEKYK